MKYFWPNLRVLCLPSGASVLSTDREGLTALSWAALRGQSACVSALVERGAPNVDVHHTDIHGRTPLDLAAIEGGGGTGAGALVYLLERGGADMERTDPRSGMRALDRAIAAHNTPAVLAFLRKGAKLGECTVLFLHTFFGLLLSWNTVDSCSYKLWYNNILLITIWSSRPSG